MFEVFKGTLYANGSGSSVLVGVTFEYDTLRFTMESGDFFEAKYFAVQLKLGGFENRLVEIGAVGVNNESLVCYIDEAYKYSFLERCLYLGHGIDRTSVEKVISEDRKAKFLAFMFDYGWVIALIAGGISTYIYYYIF